MTSLKTFLCIASVFFLYACNNIETTKELSTTNISKEKIATVFEAPSFTIKEANALLELPLHCAETEYPNKLGQTIGGKGDLQEPSTLHPIFYGCFDWHSAVHGYWSIVTLLDRFPEMDKAPEALAILERNITPKKVAIELEYFNVAINKSYERTYGWAWLLKLAEALHTWDHPNAARYAATLAPLTNKIVDNYTAFLPKLVYPIRVGEHTNTAFGLSFAYDYAATTKNTTFANLIKEKTIAFYQEDAGCPITWEPSGYDFLSPCLEELDMMRRVLNEKAFDVWVTQFMPELKNKDYSLTVGQVNDRTDGKLVHLDGLNFSRAWVLYGLANQYPKYAHLKNLAHEHVAYSYPNLVGDSYEGGHWLGSFAIYALTQYQ